MASPGGIGPIDPGHDGDAEFFAGLPASPVRTFFWISAKKLSMAALSPANLAHRSDDLATPQRLLQLPASKLRSAIRM